MDRFGVSSIAGPVAGFGLGTPNPASPYAPTVPDAQTMIAQIIAQVNAQLAAAGIASPFAGIGSATGDYTTIAPGSPQETPEMRAARETSAAHGGQPFQDPERQHRAEKLLNSGGFTDGGWMQALERLRQQGGSDRESDGQRLMREAARAARGGGRGASANANGGSITHGDIGPNTRLTLSADAGRATDRTRRRY